MKLSRSLPLRPSLAAMAVLALAGGPGLAAVTASPATAAASCDTAFPEADLTDGQAVTGLTVTHGTQPEQFTGSVIGTLKDGIAPGVDMIIMNLDSPAIEQAGGIWEGMSGSPVYASDGRLIGAVAYGLANGPSPVAGITPYADMDRYLADPAPASVAVSKTMAQRIAARSSVSARAAQQGLSQLQMPLAVSGLPAGQLSHLQGRQPWLAAKMFAAGHADASGTGAPTAADLVPGGNLASAISYGDVTSGAIGTVTSVCGDRVVGFGHPMTFSGATTMAMLPADALYIQSDSLGAPFKVANLGDPVGTVTDDHLTGITGTVGPLPDTATVSSTVSYHGRSRTGTSYVTVSEADAQTTFVEGLLNHDVVLDASIPGSEKQTWSVTGTEDGSPFTVHFDNVESSTYAINYAGYDEANTVYELSNLPGVTISTIDSTAAVSDDDTELTIASVQENNDGKLTTLDAKHPAFGHPGATIHLKLTLTGGDQPRVVYLPVTLPKGARGAVGELEVVGGNGGGDEEGDDVAISSTASRSGSTTLSPVQQIQKQLDATLRNDAIRATASVAQLHPSKLLRTTGTPKRIGTVVDGHIEVPLKLR